MTTTDTDARFAEANDAALAAMKARRPFSPQDAARAMTEYRQPVIDHRTESAMTHFRAAHKAALGYECESTNPHEALTTLRGETHVSLYRCEGYVREAYGCPQVDLHTYTEGRFIVEFHEDGPRVFKLTEQPRR